MLLWHGDHAEATHRQVNLSSVQEEADTKLILLSLDATSFGATATRICSLDTDVLVLAMRRFVTGTTQKCGVIQLQPIYNALGPNKATQHCQVFMHYQSWHHW